MSTAAFSWQDAAPGTGHGTSTANFSWVARLAVSAGLTSAFNGTAVVGGTATFDASLTFAAANAGRTAFFDCSAAFDAVNSARTLAIVTALAPAIEAAAVIGGTAEFPCMLHFDPDATSVIGTVAGIPCALDFVPENGSRASGQMRATAKAAFDPDGAFERIARFNIVATSRLDARSARYANLRLRARARLICRFRSGPWPW